MSLESVLLYLSCIIISMICEKLNFNVQRSGNAHFGMIKNENMQRFVSLLARRKPGYYTSEQC